MKIWKVGINKMEIKKKFLIVLFLMGLLMVVVYTSHFGVKAESLQEKMESQANDFIERGEDEMKKTKFETKDITTDFLGLGKILTMVGAGVMVVVTSYMGIKYITSPPDKQAALKQQLIGLVVSGIVIFGAYGIWKAILGVVSSF